MSELGFMGLRDFKIFALMGKKGIDDLGLFNIYLRAKMLNRRI